KSGGINLEPVGARRTKIPLATVRGHRAPREDGTILYRGVFQPYWIPITHPTLELESVRVHFVSFGDPPSFHLQNGAFRHHAVLEIAPERDQQLACDGDDRNPPDTPLEFANTFAEPDTQGAVRLMPQPQPRELNHHGASLGVTSLADPLLTAHRAALKMPSDRRSSLVVCDCQKSGRTLRRQAPSRLRARCS